MGTLSLRKAADLLEATPRLVQVRVATTTTVPAVFAWDGAKQAWEPSPVAVTDRVVFGKGRIAKLEAELDRLAAFAGCERVDWAEGWLRAPQAQP